MGLQGSVRVDGLTYIWTGVDNTTLGGFAANLSSIQITPTRTIFVMQAGPMNVTITYLSPIEVRECALHHLYSISETGRSAIRLGTTIISVLLRVL